MNAHQRRKARRKDRHVVEVGNTWLPRHLRDLVQRLRQYPDFMPVTL